MDGNPNTRWSAYGFPQDVVIDLGVNYNVNEVILSTYFNRDYQFIVEGSITSATSGFSVLVDASNNTDFGPISKGFETQAVRYVKLTIIGANTYNGWWSSITGFEVLCAGEVSNKSIAEVGIREEISVYPNPVQSELTVSNSANSTISIYDMNGKLILEKDIISDLETFDVSSFATGVYYAHIIGEGTITTKKIVKE